MNLWPAVCRRLVSVTALLVLVSGLTPGEPAKPTITESWPMLGGSPSRNHANPFAKNVPTEWSVEEGKFSRNVKWTATLGSVAYGCPVVAGGKIFIGTNNDRPRDLNIKDDKGIMMCLEEETGKFLWQAVHHKLANRDEDAPEVGIVSTPCVDGDRLYYVSNRCKLVCATTRGKAEGTADFVWRLDMIGQFKVHPSQLAISSPLVICDLVYVVTGNGRDQVKEKVLNPDAPSFLAVHKKTGKVAWTSNLPGASVMEGQWSSPAYAEVNGKGQVIFPGGDGWFYGLDAKDGTLIWKFDCNPKGAAARPQGRKEAKNNLIATPVVWDNKVYVGTGQTPGDGNDIGIGRFWCVDLTKAGDVSPVNDNFDPKAEVNKKSALVWQYGGPNPDAKARRKFLFCRTLCSCAVENGLLFVADFDGFLYCFDAQTGEKYWDFDLKETVWGSLAVLDGKVYVGTENGYLWVFSADKKQPAKERNRIDMQQSLKNAPVFVNGVLYVVTDGRLYAIM